MVLNYSNKKNKTSPKTLLQFHSSLRFDMKNGTEQMTESSKIPKFQEYLEKIMGKAQNYLGGVGGITENQISNNESKAVF